jgi:nucleoid DNA-binding protein
VNKNELIKVVAHEASIPTAVASEIINLTLDLIARVVESGEEVSLRDFGKFHYRFCKPRVRKQIVTQQPYLVPAQKKVRFTASKRTTAVVKELDPYAPANPDRTAKEYIGINNG